MSSQGSRNVAKGKAYERKIVNALNEHSEKYKYRRRIVTGHSASIVDVESVGDIISINGKLRFVLEMKNQKGFSLDSVLANGEKSQFFEWWSQCLNDMRISKDHDLEPILFFRGKSENLVALSTEGNGRLHKEFCKCIILNNAVFPSYGKCINIVTLKDFLAKYNLDRLCAFKLETPCAVNPHPEQ